MGKNNATMLYQLSAALASIGEGVGGFALPSGVDVRGTSKAAREAAQSGIAGEAVRKERERKNKGGGMGGLGAALGTIGGIALAPVTGGASLALAGALGGAVGGAAGRGLSGGKAFDPRSIGMDAIGGAIGGGVAGYAGGAANVAGGAAKSAGAAYNPAAASFMGTAPTKLQAANAISQGMGGAAKMAGSGGLQTVPWGGAGGSITGVPKAAMGQPLADKRGGNGFFSRLYQASKELGYGQQGLYQSFMPQMFNAGFSDPGSLERARTNGYGGGSPYPYGGRPPTRQEGLQMNNIYGVNY